MAQLSDISNKKADVKIPKISKKSSKKLEPSIANEEERFRHISDAAYYMALERGFCGGDPVQDWLTAEAIVDCRL